MKVHEETWDFVDGERLVFDEKQPDTSTFAELAGDLAEDLVYHGNANAKRLQLAMCAPEMARALLLVVEVLGDSNYSDYEAVVRVARAALAKAGVR